MRGLSPFPPDADRPWRGVWVYASHAIEERLRSWAFWLGLVGLPLLYGAAYWVVDNDPELATMVLVAEGEVGDALEEVATKNGFPVQRMDAAPDGARAVLRVEGESLAEMDATLVVEGGAEEELARWAAERMLAEARSSAFLDPAELEALEEAPAVEELAEDLGERLLGLLPMSVVGITVVFGAMSGFGAAQQLSRVRGKEYFAVLRMGTPTAVIFLGGLFEHAAMGALTVIPLGLIFLPLLLVALLGASLMRSELALALLGGVPLLAATGGLASFFLVSAVAAALGAMERGAQNVRGSASFLFLLMYPVVIPLLPVLMDRTVDGPTAWMAVPVVGTVEAAIGLGGDLGMAWIPVVALLQLPWMVAGIRVGAWAYGVDDGLLDDVRRRWVRWRLAGWRGP